MMIRQLTDSYPNLYPWNTDASQTAQMNAAYEAAKHLAPNGKSYPTANAWKFNCLIHEYKQANPCENSELRSSRLNE